MAVGGSRRSSYNVGIPVRSTVCLSYVVSGTLTSLAGVLYAARLSGVGPDTGVGLELTVVTAALLGGNSVGGGRGSIGKALMGAVIVSLLVNGLVRLGLETGAASMVTGMVLLLAISIDVRWGKWRHSLRAKVYLSPAYLALPSAPPIHAPGVFALCDQQSPRRQRDHWPWRSRRPRRRHSRSERQPLLQRASGGDRPLSRPRLHQARGLRPCRRQAAGDGVR